MNEKDREQERLENIVLTHYFYAWNKFRRENRHRIPLYPGSAIRDASIELMKEFLADKEIKS